MLDFCSLHKARIGYLVVYSVSRFSRNALDYHATRALLAAGTLSSGLQQRP